MISVPIINLDNVSFNYPGAYEDVFNSLTVSIDTSWKTGIIGRNGCGKTTLLKLINHDISPSIGNISIPIKTHLFPLNIKNTGELVINVIKDILGPYRELESLITNSSKENSEDLLKALQIYCDIDGYNIEYKIKTEILKIGLSEEILSRYFNTLSGGEQTKVQIATLFLLDNTYVLLDEPTNHLDIHGIKSLSAYLSQKHGYIVVSHNRSFLDNSIDHVLFINKSSIGIEKGNYSSWEHNENLKTDFEMRKKQRILKEVSELEKAARQRRDWAAKKEREKNSEEATDKGYIGARSAKLMKRALCIEKRIEKKLDEKKELLKDYERERNLKLSYTSNVNIVLDVSNLQIRINDKPIIKNLSFRIMEGDRIAVQGANGSGKTTLLKSIIGEIVPTNGIIKLDKRIKVAYSSQFPKWNIGYLRELLILNNIDESRYRTILDYLGTHREIFERDLSTFSVGELKKVDLAYCFYMDSCFQIWDEPLNGLDISSRKLLESAILKFKPTILFVEHDSSFIENVSTDKIILY